MPAVAVGLAARARRERAEVDERKRVEEARALRTRADRPRDARRARPPHLDGERARRALEYHPDAPPEDVAKTGGVIRTSAHAALGELREVINLLRAPADDGQYALSATLPLPT